MFTIHLASPPQNGFSRDGVRCGIAEKCNASSVKRKRQTKLCQFPYWHSLSAISHLSAEMTLTHTQLLHSIYIVFNTPNTRRLFLLREENQS